jgi:hypothetical protein
LLCLSDFFGGEFLPFCKKKIKMEKEYSIEKSLVLKRNKSPKNEKI